MKHADDNTQNISSSSTPPVISSSPTTSAAPAPIRSNHRNRVASGGGGNSGSNGNGSQACAACKYQRRRCARDCPLAPYFPAERQKDFLNAHKLFGVSNILKVLKDVPSCQKDNAMKALILQANIRADDPVGGCYQVIVNLHRQINYYQAQLQGIYGDLFRVQTAALQEQQINFNAMAAPIRGNSSSTMSFNMLPLHGLHVFNGSNSISIGEEGSSSTQIFKGKGVEGFSSSDEDFEDKTMVTISSNGKQPIVESEDIKPSFESVPDFKGKGVATYLSDDKVVSKARRVN